MEEVDNLEIRSNGVEMVKYSETLPDYKNEWIIIWRDGELQRSNHINGPWFDYHSYGQSGGGRRGWLRNFWDPWIVSGIHPSNGTDGWGRFYRLKPQEQTPSDIPVEIVK